MIAVWQPHADGFACGDIGVFPGWFGAWEIWRRIGGEWDRDPRFLKAFAVMYRDEEYCWQTDREASRLAAISAASFIHGQES